MGEVEGVGLIFDRCSQPHFTILHYSYVEWVDVLPEESIVKCPHQNLIVFG